MHFQFKQGLAVTEVAHLVSGSRTHVMIFRWQQLPMLIMDKIGCAGFNIDSLRCPFLEENPKFMLPSGYIGICSKEVDITNLQIVA